MIFRFLFEFLVGFICLLSVLVFGIVGMTVLSLYALLPLLISKITKKPDERETQLFYKAGNLSMGLMILVILLIYYFSGIKINGHLIGNHWMELSISSAIFTHGLAGLIVFKKP